MFRTGVITGVSVSHARASVDEIDAATGESVRSVVSELRSESAVEEAFALQTCNRAEAYVVTDRPADGRSAVSKLVSDVREGVVEHMDHEESLRHLMRVAAGLESLVLGEDQIIGQFKTAVEDARGAGGVGPVLEDALTKAIHVGERARTETQINEGVLSLGSAAVRLAATEVDLEGATALVVGAGEMGTLSARALVDAGVDRVVVANRTVPHAEHVADELDARAEAVPLGVTATKAASVDVIISATGSPEFVLEADQLNGSGDLVCIDIAQPRDIDPDADGIDGVSVYDIDDLQRVTDETRARRQEAATRIEAMIDEEFDRLLAAFKRRRADEAISAMYESAERVKTREVATALTKLEANGELTDEQRETVEALADALVGQLLAAPTKSLREAAAEDDWTTIQTAMRLFDPGFDELTGDRSDGAATAVAEGTAGGLPQHVLERLSDD
ncbi:MAG: glutamyl-tRNA reductase [Halobacteriota archaeon]